MCRTFIVASVLAVIGTTSLTAYERIAVPTLILSCKDDLSGTVATA